MREISLNCVVGEYVFWTTLGGNRYEGQLKEWDSNVAIVKLLFSDKTMPVEVNNENSYKI